VTDQTELLAAARGGDRRALGRLLTIAERDDASSEELAATVLSLHSPHAHVVGITGAPGAGKSTLTGRIIESVTSRGQRIAVLAVDPSSPLSGGAILGDRIRMEGPAAPSDAVFIRSLASRGQHGGLSIAVPAMIRVLEAAGYDFVVVETVGVGQVELDIAALADTTVVVVTPGWGDAIQASKAGLLEVADVFAVNKADRAGASDAVRDLEHMLDLAPPSPWRAPVRCTVATDGTGVMELLDAVHTHAAYLDASEGRSARRRARDRAELRARVERLLMGAVDDLLDSDHCTSDIVDGRQVTANVAARRVIAAIREGGEIR
jgi:LAO/AO transport system kinase